MAGITGSTRLAAVIGDPARHSLSPAIHNAGFAELGLDWVYLAFDVARGDAAAALDAMRTLGISGFSVTMPHKLDVARAVDVLEPDAAALGAVNCVVNDQGRLQGANTDGVGFVRALAHDAGFDPAGRRALVLGAGGAGRAVVRALATAGAAEVIVVNRDAGRAVAASELAGGVGRVGRPDEVAEVDLVVNATPLGMRGALADALACPVDLLHAGQIVVDLVYEPARTRLLQEAGERGASTFNGVSMLVHQAAAAFERWTGHPAPVPAMTKAVSAHLAG